MLYFTVISTKAWPVSNDQAGTPPPPIAPPPLVPPPALPLLAPEPPVARPGGGRRFLATFLGLYLALLIAGATLNLVSDLCVGLLHLTVLDFFSTAVGLFTLLGALVVYGLMALAPMVPKRIFLPATLIIPGQLVLALPVLIYFYDWPRLIDGLLSGLTVAVGWVLLRWLQGSWKLRWPLVAEYQLGVRPFSFPHLGWFILLNLLVALPAAGLYLAGCASLAVSHFTEGFVHLRPAGIILQARKYVRADGRTVVLIPMSHIADSDFYRSVSGSVSSNSVVLLEGVTDTQNLLTNGLSYRRAARALGLAEQHEAFKVTEGKLVRADVDVQEFSTNTIALLNLVALVHSQGINQRTLALIEQCSPTEEMQQQLLEDLLLRRNQHVLQELFSRLPQADSFIIPWGAAHMPGLSHELQKAGFHLTGTRDYLSIRFGSKGSPIRAPSDWKPERPD